MAIEKKLAALAKVATILNNNKVVWATGGSFLLYVNGIVDSFNDIDIMILETDVEKVKTLINECGTLSLQNCDSKYRSKAFLEYIVDDVDFDIIAGFTIVVGTMEKYFPLMQESIRNFVTINKVSIPLQSLDEWKLYYQLMGRSNKVELIGKHLSSY